MELRDCPDEFYNNCGNQIKRCRACAAGGGKPNGKLLYAPIEESEEHPYKYIPPRKPIKDKKRSQIATKARRNEKQAAERLAKQVAKLTVASGAVHGDGDAKHELSLDRVLRVEHKQRPPGSTYSVTNAEYQKGLRQQIDVWAISVQGQETMYFLRESVYAELLTLARINKDGES